MDWRPLMAHRLLTPNEVRTSTLHATWLRGGYDTDETDELLDDCAYTIQVLTEKIAELVERTRPMRPAAAQISNNLIAE